MSLVAQCLRGSGSMPRSKSRFRLNARENKVQAHLQANNARSEGLNGKPSDDRCKKTKRKLMAHFQLRAGMQVDRDCNAALNMQRIGESKWRPLELCYWPEQGKLPATGKEYPGLGYKRLRDKPPKAQQQPAAAQ